MCCWNSRNTVISSHSRLYKTPFLKFASNSLPWNWHYLFYRKSSYKVILIIYIGTGLLDWLFARKAYHIGASGIIYGFVAFLFFSGIIRRDTRAIALALLVTFLYGSLIWGILPLDSGISWESHLFGSIMGIFCAFLYKKSDPAIKYEWEYEDDNEKNINDSE